MALKNKDNREIIHKCLEVFVDGAEVNTKNLVKLMAEASKDIPCYGKARERDFRELTPLFARLFAFNNKHFFVYKAISDPNKLGFLSCRQYTKFCLLKKIWAKRGYAGSGLSGLEQEFLERNGTMASPYKMLKRAFKENPENTRFLSRYFPLAEDKKTTKNEKKLIELCDAAMQLNTGIEIVPASIQECYDLDFHGSSILGSSNRACTNSCMHGRKVGAFYEAFGAEGRMIYCHGQPVGRFLLWNKQPGWKKGVIDRMYVRGEYMNDALAALDSMFPDSEWEKYPYTRTSADADCLYIPLSHPEKLQEHTDTPYIDTFAFLWKDVATGKYFLSNRDFLEGKGYPSSYRELDELRRTSTKHHLCNCPDCHEVFWSNDPTAANSFGPTHKLYCKGYIPKTKEIKTYLEIFRKHVKSIQEAQAYARTGEIKSIFEV